MTATNTATPNGAAAGKVCVLVLGMHRSGTSALARTLNLLGCDLPKTLVPEAPGNEAGHWESAPICRLNDELLDSAGTNWRDFETVNPDWFRSPKAGGFRARAVATLADEFGDSWLYVLKDPRICRVAGWWVETIEASGAAADILSIVRHPLEVAESLKKRDSFDIALGVLLWLRNTLDAEAQTRGRTRAFVSYDGLLSDWSGALTRAQGRLGLAWPKRQSFVTPAIDQFLSERHRHHRSAPMTGGEGANAWASHAYEILKRWANDGESAADYETLDAIRARLDEAGHAFARLVALQWYHQGQAAKFEKSLTDSEKKCADAEKRLQQSAAELVETKARLSQTESALKQRSLEAEEASREVAAFKARLAEADAVARQKAEDAARALAEARDEARRAADALREANAAAAAELIKARAAAAAVLKDAKAAAAAELSKARAAAAAELRDAKAAAAADIGARFGEIAALSRLLKDRDSEAGDLRRTLSERDAAAIEAKNSEAARIEQALKALADAPLFPAMRGRQLRKRAALLKATGLFDADWYQTRYADIAATGIDPAVHFLTFGLREGRHPSADIARARGER